MSALSVTDWRKQAACSTVDPDLFFPDEDTPVERVEQAKRICDGCPVKRACLKDAMQRGEKDGICGGLTPNERQQLLNPGQVITSGGRRVAKTSARQLAVKHGSYLMVALVEWRVPVAQVAADLGSTPGAVYRAYQMLVPPRPGQRRLGNNRPVVEELLRTSKEQLKTLERRGLSHSEIGVVLGVAQSFVSAALAVLRQREEGMRLLSRDGAVDPLERLRAEDSRILLESGMPLGVNEVINVTGDAIVRMHEGEGKQLRQVAAELGVCREVVRKAYLVLTSDRQGPRAVTKSEMGEAA